MKSKQPDLIDMKMASKSPSYSCPPGHVIVVYEGGPPRNKRSKGKTEVYGYAHSIDVMTYRKAYNLLEVAAVDYKTFVAELDRQRGKKFVPVMMFTPSGHCLITVCVEFKFGTYERGGHS